MRRHLIMGGGLALVAAVLALFNTAFGLQSLWVLLIGAAVVLVPAPSLPGRLTGVVLGVILAWGAFALRAAVLPDIPAGRALAAAIPILLITGVVTLTRGRLPLWAALVGLTTFYGAYEAVFAASPTDFIEQSVATMTSVLLLMSVGALAGVALAPRTIAADETAVTQPVLAGDDPRAELVIPTHVPADLDDLRSAGTVS